MEEEGARRLRGGEREWAGQEVGIETGRQRGETAVEREAKGGGRDVEEGGGGRASGGESL